MKVYLACSSVDLTIPRLAITELREAGHTITFDWTHGFEEAEQANDPQILMARAEMDIYGVVQADVVVFYLAPGMRSTGCFIEVGAALGRHKPVLVCEEQSSFEHFFCNHPWLMKVETFGMVLATLHAWESDFEARGRQWLEPPKIPFLTEVFKSGLSSV